MKINTWSQMHPSIRTLIREAAIGTGIGLAFASAWYFGFHKPWRQRQTEEFAKWWEMSTPEYQVLVSERERALLAKEIEEMRKQTEE